jgi:predicted nucleic acid binding AN1-type Zn finger protein
MEETTPNIKRLLDVIYLIVCEYCGRVKWRNRWMHFSEVDKKELVKRKVYRKVVTCKDCIKSARRNMELINQPNAKWNWFKVLELWNQIANRIHYQIPEAQLRHKMKSMLLFLLNEKDWLKTQYPTKAEQIDQAINSSKYMRTICALAKTVKRRSLIRHRRSDAEQTKYYGKVGATRGTKRLMYFISIGNGKHKKIMPVLRGALDEFDELRFGLKYGMFKCTIGISEGKRGKYPERFRNAKWGKIDGGVRCLR